MADKSSATIIDFVSGSSAWAVEATRGSEPYWILAQLNLPRPAQGVIAVSGGASDFPPHTIAATSRLMHGVLELAFEHNLMLIDGGTRTGVMQIIGQIFSSLRQNGRFRAFPPLIGFVPQPRVHYPGASKDGARPGTVDLDDNHPYFVMIRDAKQWGDEVGTMFRFVDAVAERVPSVSLVANGGLTTLAEVEHSIKEGRDIVVLDGSCRATRAICASLTGASEATLIEILHDPRERLVALQDPDHDAKLERALHQLYSLAVYHRVQMFNMYASPNNLKELLLSFLI